MTDLWPAWVIGGLILMALEAHQQAFYAVFISAACFAAAVASALGGDFWVQGGVFALVGFGGIVTVRRPIALYFARRAVHITIPGTYGGFVGQNAIALDEIGDEHHPGHAKFRGDTYLAITDGDKPLIESTELVVVDMRGTTLLVRARA